ncbi:internal scaffolding protein [Blackfly microvirus SF02]|uniref:Internal scaffolding protein n=1 Tax=Blackfly microvirus SF02 TaxID=2576452 RepID=A0A4V1F5G7_9VIRU|nr:internal scaffolding protein [Blackfly microvirus SF02]
MTTTPTLNFYRPHKRVKEMGLLYNPATKKWEKPVTRVKQSFVKECDINSIMKQYSLTGQINHISSKASQGAYLDLPDDTDFQSSMEIIKQGENAFATLPSYTRDRFGNNAENFLAFMADPRNAEEAIKLGLATKRPEPVAHSAGGGDKPPKPPAQAAASASPAPKPGKEPEGS